MTSETFVTGGIPRSGKPAIGALVRQFAARLSAAGHLEAEVRGWNGRFVVVHAEVFPHTAPSHDVKTDLEAYLNEARQLARD
jgi:hypothetical protein